jgi:type I restriction enzyme, S subunit
MKNSPLKSSNEKGDGISVYATYPEYKDSGVEWLGEIPAEWEITKLGSCLSSFSEKNNPNLPLLSITRELGVIERDIENQDANHNYIPDDLSGYKLLKRGQFGMNKMKAWQGSYGVSPLTGIVSPAYFMFDIIKEIDPVFFHIAIRSKLYVSFFGSASDGVRIGQWDLSKTRMKEIPLTLPSILEQTAIAEFLDDKIAKIDALVEIKRQQIALLEERKQILIQNAVTKGLNPDAPMKDSGVDWIGTIPAHWKVKRSKYVFNQRKCLALYDDVQLSATQAYGVIPQKEYEEKVGRRVVKIQFNLEKRKHVEIDDFVISMRSFQGGLERARASGCIRSSYVILQPTAEVVPIFFSYVLKSPRYIKAIQTTASFIRDGQDLNFENFSKVDLFIPPYKEQQKIATYIDNESKKIDAAITIKQKQTAKLIEYKTTLINAAVTGKIKVMRDSHGL